MLRNTVFTACCLFAAVVFWLSVEFTLKPLFRGAENVPHTISEIAGDSTEHHTQPPACGQVCSYTLPEQDTQPFTFLPTQTNTTMSIPRLEKHIDCQSIMQRMAWREYNIVYPPPKEPPEHLLLKYTQGGEFPLGKPMYLINFVPNQFAEGRHYPEEDILGRMKQMKEGQNINVYPDEYCMQNLTTKYKASFQGAAGCVVGTEFPWLEAMLLHHGAKTVTTLEYNPLTFAHPQLKAVTPYDFADMYLNGTVERFDFATSFSSIEHSGLGRYGDPLNPYGDMEAMAQMWCAVKPGGLFIVGIPGRSAWEGRLQWNAHRIYGVERLKHLAANWNILEVTDCIKGFHVVMVLSKPVE